MFWKNREKIKALEKEVEDLREDNEKIHRILKHVGKEPCFEIIGKTIHDDSYEPGNYIWEYHKRLHTLYFYKDNSEYSVHLKEFDNKDVVFTNCEVTGVTGTLAHLKVTVVRRWYAVHHINIHNYGGATYDDRLRSTYLIRYDYVDGVYYLMQTFEDDEKLYREIFCKKCDKNSDGEEKKNE